MKILNGGGGRYMSPRENKFSWFSFFSQILNQISVVACRKELQPAAEKRAITSIKFQEWILPYNISYLWWFFSVFDTEKSFVI